MLASAYHGAFYPPLSPLQRAVKIALLGEKIRCAGKTSALAPRGAAPRRRNRGGPPAPRGRNRRVHTKKVPPDGLLAGGLVSLLLRATVGATEPWVGGRGGAGSAASVASAAPRLLYPEGEHAYQQFSSQLKADNSSALRQSRWRAGAGRMLDMLSVLLGTVSARCVRVRVRA